MRKFYTQMIEKLSAQVDELVVKALESTDDEEVKRLESCMNRIESYKKKLDDLDEKEAFQERKADPKKENELSESARFVKRMFEAINLGTGFADKIPAEMMAHIDAKKASIAKLRNLCTVHSGIKGDVIFLADSSDLVVSYVGEGTAFGETGTAPTPVKLYALKLGALVKISNEFLADITPSYISYLEDRIAKALAEKEDHDILLGTGTASSKAAMRGIVTNIASTQVVTAASASTITWAEVQATISKINAYRSHATIVMNWAVADIIKGFKDGNGVYIFDQQKDLSYIGSIPVVISEQMPAVATKNAAMVVGDFSYYHLADREGMDVKILSERFADTDQTGVIFKERIDGDFGVAGAFAVLKLA